MIKLRAVGIGVLMLAYSMALGQADLLRQVEAALSREGREAVYDFGRLLRRDGVAELRTLAEEFRSDGLSLYFVTVPPGRTDVNALATTVYRDLRMTEKDVLITFDGRRFYAEALALRGDRRAFQEATRIAQPAFRLYHARGLAAFARSLHDSILQKRQRQAAEQEAATQRWQVVGALGAVALLAGAGAVAYPRLKRRASTQRDYQKAVEQANEIYQHVAINMPTELPQELNDQFLQLAERLRACRDTEGTKIEDVDRLIADLRRFEAKVREMDTQLELGG